MLFPPQNSTVAVAGDDEVVRLGDLGTEKWVCEFKAHETRWLWCPPTSQAQHHVCVGIYFKMYIHIFCMITGWKQWTVLTWRITVCWWRLQMMDSSKCGNCIWKRFVTDCLLNPRCVCVCVYMIMNKSLCYKMKLKSYKQRFAGFHCCYLLSCCWLSADASNRSWNLPPSWGKWTQQPDWPASPCGSRHQCSRSLRNQQPRRRRHKVTICKHWHWLNFIMLSWSREQW